MAEHVIGWLLRRLWRPRVIRVGLRDLVFEIPGREGNVTSLGDVPEVMAFHEGALVLRNCEVHGAVEFRLHSREGVLIIKGIAGSAIRYIPPS